MSLETQCKILKGSDVLLDLVMVRSQQGAGYRLGSASLRSLRDLLCSVLSALLDNLPSVHLRSS